jgi:phage FluMu protein Com
LKKEIKCPHCDEVIEIEITEDESIVEKTDLNVSENEIKNALLVSKIELA